LQDFLFALYLFMKIINLVLGYAFILFSFIPFIRQDDWFFRIFEYPRFQKLLISLGLLLSFLLFFNEGSTWDHVFIIASGINITYILWLVYPFTRFSAKQVQTLKKNATGASLKALIFNVLQDNKDYSSILKLIKEYHPDIICLVETDKTWLEQVKPELINDYPHTILSPLANTYGMIFFSKLKLEDEEICFIVKNDIPSISTKVVLESGDKVQLYCVHPEPPVPNENPKSTARDKELLLVGKKAKEQPLPVIVMGDLNDVAWSYTTELFCKVSELLDPRKGRGFFNTFNAQSRFLRFPLDHIFCSSQFMVSKIKRLPYAGSDHFPMYIELVLVPEKQSENDTETADKEDIALANEKINKPVMD
jgi:endonuclease/exonuclease/phosphatase (EEP) superfamily protein YafD